MSFLSGLGNIINEQFGTGENTTHSINNGDGIDSNFGMLGKYAKNMDKSAERYYYEDGFVRNIRPRNREIITQQPDITVVIKKRMFSSLVSNSRLNLLEKKERLLIQASKRLFQNKCKLISAYELLTKIEKYTEKTGAFNTHLGASLFNSIDAVTNVLPINEQTKSALEKLRKVLSYSESNETTSWTTNDWDAVFGNEVGEGPGSFELTNVSSLNTNASIEYGGGSCSLTIDDPYNLMRITDRDIDQAIADVSNQLKAGRFFKSTEIDTLNSINDLKQKLYFQRSSRGASNITIIVSPGTVFNKRVRAVVDETGQEIIFTYNTGVQQSLDAFAKVTNFEQAAQATGELFSSGGVQIDKAFLGEGKNQLNAADVTTFVNLIKANFTLLDFRATSQNKINRKGENVNYVRNRMMMMFNGKYLIQPMDVVNIFLTSRTREDQVLQHDFKNLYGLGGLKTAEKFDSILKNMNSIISSSSESSFEFLEKNVTVGSDFPLWLWRMYKNDITKQAAGTTIFVGLCKHSSGTYSDGKFTVSVQCEDNTGYFDKGQVNFQPSAEVFNSTIYDPLTPFDVSFDASTGVPQTSIADGDFPPLLPENQALLQTGSVLFKNGPNKNSKADLKGFQTENSEIAFDNYRRVLYEPDGLVYRWKQGIQTLTKSGRPFPKSSTEEERTILMTNKPFAGQDVMNVISLLVTGQPYNYGTFLKAAINNGNSIGVTDSSNNKPVAQTYIEGLVLDLQKNNAIWGNFVPFKKLVVDRDMDKLISEASLNLDSQNGKLAQKLAERARLTDEVTLISQGFALDTSAAYSTNSEGGRATRDPGSTADNPETSQFTKQIQKLDKEILNLQTEYINTIKSSNASSPNFGVVIVGNQIDINQGVLDLNNSKQTENQKQYNDLELRRRMGMLTQRRLWSVKANQDQNLFIVDDQYDKNFDIAAFERKIGGKTSLFNSEYSSVSDMIKNTATILGLEIFANTQGHIEVRPPAYNKMPSSIFYKMFRDRDVLGIKVFPEFLENLYFNQIRGIFDRLEIIEDEIRLRATCLGSKNDKAISTLLKSGVTSKISTNNDFSFVTSEDTGKISGNLNTLLIQSNVEDRDSKVLSAIQQEENKFKQIAGARVVFDTSVQADISTAEATKLNVGDISNRINVIRDRLRMKTGREPATLSQLYSNNKFSLSLDRGVSKVDQLNIINQLSTFVYERQTLIQSATNTIKNLKEGLTVNGVEVKDQTSTSKNAGKSALTPNLYRKSGIPQLLSHMIEYEEDDDLGPGSGKRFIIRGGQYSTLTLSENPPPYTAVTVNGLIGQGFVDAPGSLQTSSDGNAITSAYAVDYDMMYMYGFKISNAIQAPFFSDPDSQCAPYAVANLIKMRESILCGSVDILAYNEFYQPGDVVFIEDVGMLFYVKSVGHNFSYGSLKTTLELTFGHNPGEYIPNLLDVVGKILYNSKGFSGQFRSDRYDTLGAARSLGAILYDPGNKEATTNEQIMSVLLQGRVGERNRGLLSNILLGTSGALNQVNLKRVKPTIKLRYYSRKEDDDNQDIQSAVDVIKTWLVNPELFSNSSQELVRGNGNGNTFAGMSPKTSFGLSESDIVIEEVNLDKQEYSVIDPADEQVYVNDQGPSSAAWEVVRNRVGPDSKPANMNYILSHYIVDIFISYNDISATPVINSEDSDSQNGQDKQAATDTAREERI